MIRIMDDSHEFGPDVIHSPHRPCVRSRVSSQYLRTSSSSRNSRGSAGKTHQTPSLKPPGGSETKDKLISQYGAF